MFETQTSLLLWTAKSKRNTRYGPFLETSDTMYENRDTRNLFKWIYFHLQRYKHLLHHTSIICNNNSKENILNTIKFVNKMYLYHTLLDRCIVISTGSTQGHSCNCLQTVLQMSLDYIQPGGLIKLSAVYIWIVSTHKWYCYLWSDFVVVLYMSHIIQCYQNLQPFLSLLRRKAEKYC